LAQRKGSAKVLSQKVKSPIVRSSASKVQKNINFFFKSAFCQVALVYSRLCRIAIAISMAHSFRQFSLIFPVIKLHHQVKDLSNCLSLLNFCKILQNAVEISKFCRKGKILWLDSKFRCSRNTVGSTASYRWVVPW